MGGCRGSSAIRDLCLGRGPLGGDTTPLKHLVLLGPVFALAGAGSAARSLALARMAEDQELLDASADVGAAGLAEDEGRELLGDGG